MNQNWERSLEEIGVFTPDVQRWLASVLGVSVDDMTITGAHSDEDKHYNTDMIVRAGGKEISVALGGRWLFAESSLKKGFYDAFVMFHTQFTVRKSRPSGRTSEESKIRSGYGGLKVYYWCDPECLLMATLIDLNRFRRYLAAGLKPFDSPRNWDNSSDFNAYELLKAPLAVRATWINPIASKNDRWLHRQFANKLEAAKAAEKAARRGK